MTSNPKARAWRGRIIRPISIDRVEDIHQGLLSTDESGKIIFCGPFDKKAAGAKSATEIGDAVIFPGFVDAHTHLSQIDCRGMHGLHLEDWLTKHIFPAEAKFEDLNYAKDASDRFFNELLANGTTMAGVLLSTHMKAADISFETAKKMGMRIAMGKAMMDQNSPTNLLEKTDRSLEESDELCKKWNGENDGKIKYAFYPRFAPTCSLKMWEGVANLSKAHSALVHTHAAETKNEVDEFKKLFPGFADYFSLFEKTGLAGPSLMLAHAINFTESEFEKIAQTGTSIVHCPSSNIFLKSGRFPFELALKHNVSNIALGTDIGAGPSLSMFDAMRSAENVQTEIDVAPESAFYMATVMGANALGFRGHNSLRVGTPADFVLAKTPNSFAKTPDNMTAQEILDVLISLGDDRNIVATFIDGNCKYSR